MKSMLIVFAALVFAVYAACVYIPFILPFEIADYFIWRVPIGRSLSDLKAITIDQAIEFAEAE